MARNIEKITEEALRLDLRARAALARRLLESLDDLSREETEGLWTELALDRYQDFKEGRVAGIAASEVFRKSRARRS